MKINSLIKSILPCGSKRMIDWLRYNADYSKLLLKYQNPDCSRLIGANEKIKNKYNSKERCFILGTGHSINFIDLKKLEFEHCIFLNQFYHHSDYTSITTSANSKEKFHFFSGYGIHSSLISLEEGIKWYQQTEKFLNSKVILLLNYLDYDFVRENNFFAQNKKHYFYFTGSLNRDYVDNISFNLTAPLYRVTNAPQFAIQIAMGMGFKEIYLLGVDYCYHPDCKGRYFYSEEKCYISALGTQKDEGYKPYEYREVFDAFADGLHTIKNASILEVQCRAFLNLIEEWRLIKEVAQKEQVKIYNASPHSILDVFPRAKYDDLFG